MDYYLDRMNQIEKFPLRIHNKEKLQLIEDIAHHISRNRAFFEQKGDTRSDEFLKSFGGFANGVLYCIEDKVIKHKIIKSIDKCFRENTNINLFRIDGKNINPLVSDISFYDVYDEILWYSPTSPTQLAFYLKKSEHHPMIVLSSIINLGDYFGKEIMKSVLQTYSSCLQEYEFPLGDVVFTIINLIRISSKFKKTLLIQKILVRLFELFGENIDYESQNLILETLIKNNFFLKFPLFLVKFLERTELDSKDILFFRHHKEFFREILFSYNFLEDNNRIDYRIRIFDTVSMIFTGENYIIEDEDVYFYICRLLIEQDFFRTGIDFTEEIMINLSRLIPDYLIKILSKREILYSLLNFILHPTFILKLRDIPLYLLIKNLASSCGDVVSAMKWCVKMKRKDVFLEIFKGNSDILFGLIEEERKIILEAKENTLSDNIEVYLKIKSEASILQNSKIIEECDSQIYTLKMNNYVFFHL